MIRKSDSRNDSSRVEEPQHRRGTESSSCSSSSSLSSPLPSINRLAERYRRNFLNRAKPGTRLYEKIHDSHPVRAAKILHKYLDVKSASICYLMNGYNNRDAKTRATTTTTSRLRDTIERYCDNDDVEDSFSQIFLTKSDINNDENDSEKIKEEIAARNEKDVEMT